MKYFPAVGLGIFTVAFLAAAYGYPSQARAFPVAVALVTLFLVALDILSRTDAKAGAVAKDARPLGRQIGAVIWLAGLALALVLIGILYTVPVYIFASLRFRGRRPWFKCVWITAIATGGIWLLFAVVLRLELYPGYFFGGS